MEDRPTSPVKEDGKTAIIHKRGLNMDKTVIANGKTYVFRGRGGVFMAWVSAADVEAVLGIRRICCGGQSTPEFVPANSAQVAYWVKLNGGQKE